MWDGKLEVVDWRVTLDAMLHLAPLGPGMPVEHEGGLMLLDGWVLDTGRVEKGFAHTVYC